MLGTITISTGRQAIKLFPKSLLLLSIHSRRALGWSSWFVANSVVEGLELDDLGVVDLGIGDHAHEKRSLVL